MAEQAYAPHYGKSWALVIGIDAFQAAPPLSTARRGAEAVADLLTSRYRFDKVTTLYDEAATQQSILDAYSDLRYQMEPDDRFVVYVAGHGIGITGTLRAEGWLLAHDSDPARQRRMIRMRDLVDPNYTRAKHSLVVLDTCHSGYAVAYEEPRAVLVTSPDPREAMKHYLTRRAVQVFASANPLETATDAALIEGHTPFTGYFLRALSTDEPAARSPVTSLLTSESVAEYVRDSVAAFSRSWQGPQIGILPGDEGGLLVWQLPDALGMLPDALQRDLSDAHPRVRYYAIEGTADLLDDPRYGSSARAVLERLVIDDPDPAVRRRAYEELSARSAPAPAPPAEVAPPEPAPEAVAPAPEPAPASEAATPSPAAPEPAPAPAPTPAAPGRLVEKPARAAPSPAQADTSSFLRYWWRVGVWLVGIIVLATQWQLTDGSFSTAGLIALGLFPGVLGIEHLVGRRWLRGGLNLYLALCWLVLAATYDNWNPLYFLARYSALILVPVAIVWTVVDAIRVSRLEAEGREPASEAAAAPSPAQAGAALSVLRRWWRSGVWGVGVTAFAIQMAITDGSFSKTGLVALSLFPAVLGAGDLVGRRWLRGGLSLYLALCWLGVAARYDNWDGLYYTAAYSLVFLSPVAIMWTVVDAVLAKPE